MTLIFFGLLTGSVLAVAAVGFAMVRQTEGFLNIAHGQLLLLGGLLGFYLTDGLGLPLLVGGLLAVVLVGLIGVALAWLIFFPIGGKSLLARFFTSIGLAFLLYGLVSASWVGSGIKIYAIDFGMPVDLLLVRATPGELAVLGIAWAAVLGLHLFLAHTPLGMSIRAVANNPELARARGVRVLRVRSVVWFLASASAAAAGVLIGVLDAVTAEMGWHYILLILAVAVMGGVRSLYGAMASGVVLGLVMELSQLVIPSKYGMLVTFGVIILTLILRPEGLFSLQKRREVGA